MMAASHIVVAASSYTALAVLAQDLPLDVWHLCLAGLGALVPDIDHQQSTLGRRLRWISPLVAALCGHRGATHSLLAAFLAAVLAIGLFVLLPIGIVELIELLFGEMNLAWSTVVQGLIRLAIFLLYIYGISRIKDIKRVFMYHGAEHKTIACYEAELDMTPENAAKCTRLHPRCGTNYLFLTMAVSIVVTTAFTALCTLIPGFAEWEKTGANRFLFRLARIVLIPLIAGVSYEVLKAAAKRDNLVCRVVRAPGLALQHLTTQEPTLDMLEVAIASFELALHPPKGDLTYDPSTPLQKAEQPTEPEASKTEEPAQ